MVKNYIIDTNVMRVITRVMNIPFRDSLRRNKKFQQFAQDLVYSEAPRDYNFALLDFANEICTPKKPVCPECPLNELCKYKEKTD